MSTNAKLILLELSYKIMGVLFKVHNALGPSLLEKYYQRAVAKELRNNKIPFSKEVSVDLEYRRIVNALHNKH